MLSEAKINSRKNTKKLEYFTKFKRQVMKGFMQEKKLKNENKKIRNLTSYYNFFS